MSTLSMPGRPSSNRSSGRPLGVPGRHRARLVRARLRRRFRLGPIHRARRRFYDRPLLCSAMPSRSVVLLVAVITVIWLVVGLA